jgi:transcriptional regulator with XRE-family HTH domain
MPGLRHLRTERRLTLEALSILADVDVATISRLERRLTEARPETIVKLARGLGISARRMRSILSERDGDAA